jgi:hypothetical protein
MNSSDDLRIVSPLKFLIRNLPPELTYDELKENLANYMPHIRHLHFIPGRSPAFYPNVDLFNHNNGQSPDGTKTSVIRTSKGNFTFSSKLGAFSESTALDQSPEDIFNSRLALEQHFVLSLGGQLSSAFISFADPKLAALFLHDFDRKIFESSRGRFYRSQVITSFADNDTISSAFDDWDLWSTIDSKFLDTSFYNIIKGTLPEPEVKKASVTFEQQTEVILRQELEMHPWKYDPKFIRSTPLLSYLDQAAIKLAANKKKSSKTSSPFIISGPAIKDSIPTSVDVSSKGVNPSSRKPKIRSRPSPSHVKSFSATIDDELPTSTASDSKACSSPGAPKTAVKLKRFTTAGSKK